MKNKSTTDNYNPSGKGKNSTDNSKDGPLDGFVKGRHPARMAYDKSNESKAKEPRATKKADSKFKKAKEKKNVGVIGGYKFLTRKRNVQ